MIEAILQYLFWGNYDGTYVHRAPLLVEELKKRPELVTLEYLSSGCIRAWTIEGYSKYVLSSPIKQKISIKDLQEQMALALEEGNVEKILLIRKQIKELNL